VKIDIEAYYRTYGPMVLRRCRYILKDEELAVDAMQETFVRILKGRDRLKGHAPSSLLYTTATNVCLNMIRDSKRKKEYFLHDDIQVPEHGESWEKRLLTGHFLDRLFEQEADSTRTMAYLHYVDGFTLEETARQTGLSVSGVRKRLGKLREKSLALKEA
jgi:RNA polymerase sigma-70 factor, ECF subfamily